MTSIWVHRLKNKDTDMGYSVFKVISVVICCFMITGCDTAAIITKLAGEETPQTAQSDNASEVDPDNPFSKKLKDKNARLDRLEGTVFELKSEFKSVLPSIESIESMDTDMKSLLNQLEELVMAEKKRAREVEKMASMRPRIPPVSMASKANARPTPVVNNANAKRSKHSMSASGLSIKNLRFGFHKDKTRIVLDTTGPIRYHHDLDNGENILVVELPKASWLGSKNWSSKKSALVSSYSVQDIEGGGARLIILLKHEARISYEATLKPAGSQKDHRIVLDLVSNAVHKS